PPNFLQLLTMNLRERPRELSALERFLEAFTPEDNVWPGRFSILGIRIGPSGPPKVSLFLRPVEFEITPAAALLPNGATPNAPAASAPPPPAHCPSRRGCGGRANAFEEYSHERLRPPCRRFDRRSADAASGGARQGDRPAGQQPIVPSAAA